MTAMLTMVAVKFGVRLVTLVGLKHMTELFLMTRVIAMRDAVHNDIGGPFQTHEEQGQDHKLAN